MKRLASLSLGLAMTLLASQAFAFGGVAPSHVGAVGAARVAASGLSGVNVNGAVTLHGITVLPNGKLIVPAVIPRPHGSFAPRAGDAGVRMQPIYTPCVYATCGP